MLGAKFWFWSLKFLGWALLTIEFYVELSSNLSVHSSLWLHLNFPFNCRWAARYGIAVALPVSCDQISISSLLFGGQMLGGDCLVAVCDTTDCSPSIFGVIITILTFLFYFDAFWSKQAASLNEQDEIVGRRTPKIHDVSSFLATLHRLQSLIFGISALFISRRGLSSYSRFDIDRTQSDCRIGFATPKS